GGKKRARVTTVKFSCSFCSGASRAPQISNQESDNSHTARCEGERSRRCFALRLGQRASNLSNEKELGDCFILHPRNNPAPLSGHRCAQGMALPTYCCRDDGRCHSSDCPPRRKRACLLQCRW